MNTKLDSKDFTISPQLITLGYALLICIGYWFQNLYYQRFGIQIESYLNFQEYLFIFLPLASLLIFLFFIGVTYFTGFNGILYVFYKSGWLNKKEKLVTPNDDGEKILNHSNRFKIPLEILKGVIIITIIVIPIIVIVLIKVEGNPKTYWKDIKPYIYIWGGIISLVYLIAVYSYSSFSVKALRWLYYSLLSTTLIATMIDLQYEKSDKILLGIPIENVQFTIKGDTITSTNTILYVGETRDYLFMRDIESNSNLIYQKKEMSALKVSEVQEVEPITP
ncbi:hypothetical protein [Arenibacter amylolyticus]|uniref:hypothetical protein n=1 Tax=Arenibacter amylolyticus TaxID=1406873 RepID=UPI000A3D2F21|nr:hypothetical protein [Arenibacter amylolyticus]